MSRRALAACALLACIAAAGGRSILIWRRNFSVILFQSPAIYVWKSQVS
jgi:hypothetical protein